MTGFRLAQRRPIWRRSLFGSLVWGAAMAASAALSLWMQRWATPQSTAAVVALFGAGGIVAFAPAWFFARRLRPNGLVETRFAAAFLCLAVTTIGATGALYALQYRDYYSQWHAPMLSTTWAFQFVFTTLSALYQFAVLGVRLYFPLGFAALTAASVVMAARPR